MFNVFWSIPHLLRIIVILKDAHGSAEPQTCDQLGGLTRFWKRQFGAEKGPEATQKEQVKICI